MRSAAADRRDARVVPINPVSTGIDLELTGGTNPSGIGGTAFTQTRYQFTVVRLDPLLPDVVDSAFSGFASVSVENNQPQGIPTWFSYGLIWVDSREFAVRSLHVTDYTGLFEDEWHQVPLGSFAVGAIGTIELDAFSHGEGSGPDFRFHSQVLIDPTIEVSSPNAQGYRVEFSPGIAGASGGDRAGAGQSRIADHGTGWRRRKDLQQVVDAASASRRHCRVLRRGRARRWAGARNQALADGSCSTGTARTIQAVTRPRTDRTRGAEPVGGKREPSSDDDELGKRAVPPDPMRDGGTRYVQFESCMND